MRSRALYGILGGLGIILAWGLIFAPSYLFAGQVSLTSVVAKEPLAILLDIQGTGSLERGTDTYTITKSGIGFKKEDTFTISSGASDYAIITLNKKGTSYVKLGPGASITFLDDDGNFAITGVYVEGSSSNYADLTFNINHASPESPFFIWTPDIVVGVRGTWLLLKVKNHTAPNPDTQILGEYKGGFTWEPDDVRIYPLDPTKFGLPANSTIDENLIIDSFSDFNLDQENFLIDHSVNLPVIMDPSYGQCMSPVTAVHDYTSGGTYLLLTTAQKLVGVNVSNIMVEVVDNGTGGINKEEIEEEKKHKYHKLKKLKHKGKHGEERRFLEILLDKGEELLRYLLEVL